jgi:bifunctional UDP-N-acetylglucosamine pyrophosphorylase/glucosamine-1-phosphate N-acetyltransferase
MSTKVIYSMMRVGKTYPPNKQVLRDITLGFYYGAKIGVLGLNGSGKSTLLRIMAGIDDNHLGETMIATGYTVGYLEQEPQLDDSKTVRAIVEEKDCTIEQRAITWVNSGILVADARRLRVWLNNLSDDNAQHEYYLTDIYAQADEEGDPADACECNNSQEVFGANDPWQLAALERLYQRMQATALASQGVRFADPIRFDVRGKVSVGRDVEIDVDVILEGEVHIGDEVTIGPFTRISNSRLAAGTVIHAHCDIEGVTTHGPCVIGPFARLRPGTELGAGSRIGNFVETKKLKLGAGSKINHLSYIGDAEVGQHANIGAGTITCNYDGVNKHQTQIGDGAFIGSNSALVAPVAIGRNATIGAGSVITRNAPDDELTVGRSRQATIPGWRRPKKS